MRPLILPWNDRESNERYSSCAYLWISCRCRLSTATENARCEHCWAGRNRVRLRGGERNEGGIWLEWPRLDMTLLLVACAFNVGSIAPVASRFCFVACAASLSDKTFYWLRSKSRAASRKALRNHNRFCKRLGLHRIRRRRHVKHPVRRRLFFSFIASMGLGKACQIRQEREVESLRRKRDKHGLATLKSRTGV